MKFLFFISAQLFVCFSFMPFVHAQETCKVLLSSISSKYEGPCKKGKAEGEGKAEGAEIEITKYSNDKNNTITIELSNTSGGIPGLGASAMGAKASITEISVLMVHICG